MAIIYRAKTNGQFNTILNSSCPIFECPKHITIGTNVFKKDNMSLVPMQLMPHFWYGGYQHFDRFLCIHTKYYHTCVFAVNGQRSNADRVPPTLFVPTFLLYSENKRGDKFIKQEYNEGIKRKNVYHWIFKGIMHYDAHSFANTEENEVFRRTTNGTHYNHYEVRVLLDYRDKGYLVNFYNVWDQYYNRSIHYMRYYSPNAMIGISPTLYDLNTFTAGSNSNRDPIHFYTINKDGIALVSSHYSNYLDVKLHYISSKKQVQLVNQKINDGLVFVNLPTFTRFLDPNENIAEIYKFGYDNTNKKYVLKRCEVDIAANTFNVQDCECDLSDLDTYCQPKTSYMCFAVKYLKDSNGDEYLLTFHYGLGRFYNYNVLKATWQKDLYEANIKGNIQKAFIKLFKIDQTNRSKLTLVHTYSSEKNDIFVGFVPLNSDFNKFAIMYRDRVEIIKLDFNTGFQKLFDYKVFNPLSIGSDEFGRLYVIDGDMNVHMLAEKFPSYVECKFEKDKYELSPEDLPYDTKIILAVKDINGDYVSATVKGKIKSENALFKATNSREIQITTNDNAETEVLIQITNIGEVDVEFDIIQINQ